MYSLDINFLKDRPEFQKQDNRRGPRPAVAIGNWTEAYVGAGVGLLLVAVAAGAWVFLQGQNQNLGQQIAEVDRKLDQLGIQEKQLKEIQTQTTQINGETQALASVFNQIRPWSAMLEDLRERVPAQVGLDEVKQIAPDTPQKDKPATNPAGGVQITGIARSFNDVNDFLLTLQQSPFLKPTDTRIVTAELIDSPIQLIGSQLSPDAKSKLPKIVRYTIQSNLSDVPASDLIRELERNGTVGLVARIRDLQQKGVIHK